MIGNNCGANSVSGQKFSGADNKKPPESGGLKTYLYRLFY
jgi:hypothetical protein